MIAEIDYRKILDEKFYAHDIDEAITVRQYLSRLLCAVVTEGECFSGKRPFGNSGWEDFMAIPAIKSGLLEGLIDKSDPNYQVAVDYDHKEFRKLQGEVVFYAMRP